MIAPQIRIILADDHPVLREGLRVLLRSEPGFEIVGEESDGGKVLEAVDRLRPDLVVMDVSLQGLNGIEATRRLHATRPETKVVVLSMHADSQTVSRAFAAGARGYVLKGGDFRALCEAIRTVMRGELYVSPELSTQAPGMVISPAGDENPLSRREQEILELIAVGNTSKQIAIQLGLRLKTVENHRANIKAKLGIPTTAGLVRFVLSARTLGTN